MSRVLAAAVLLALLGPARAQPGPGGPPPSLDQLAAEFHRHPTDARSVRPRFGIVMASLRFRGIPPTSDQMKRLQEIRGMLGAGRLSPAAARLDALVADLAVLRPAPLAAVQSLPPPAAAAPGGRAARPAEPAEPALLGTPLLLSTPMVTKPVASLAPALIAPAAEAPAARAVTAPTPEPGPPWPLFAAAAGLLLIGGAAGLFLSTRRAEKPAGPKIALRRFEPEPAAAPATLDGKYALGRVIASGGMGEVYEGKDLTLGRRVAIKRMLADLQIDAGLRAQFLKEARTVAKLSHPYIVPIHEALEKDGELWLVFEYVEGETLARRLTRDARLPLKECRRVLRYVAQAVDYAHGRHVLHRDLKPANVMLDASGLARVMDFGIALESTRTATSASPGVLDASGTLRYMPPEQHYGRSVRASDVYAMGVCLYETATGHPPFAAESVDELIALKRAARFPPPSALIPGLPKELDLFMTAVLAPDAAKRVSSAAEFLDLLDGLPV